MEANHRHFHQEMMTSALQSCVRFTPSALASALAKRIHTNTNHTWLEPSSGEGRFVRAIHSLGIPAKQVTAVELDPLPTGVDELATVIRGTDFLDWVRRNEVRFDRILANPPFVNLSKLPPQLQKTALESPPYPGDVIRKNSNYWYLFLCACLSQLAEGGSLAFILPSAWDYADYASRLRSELPSQFQHFEVHRCLSRIFPDALDGRIIIVGTGYKKTHIQTSRLIHDDVGSLLRALSKPKMYQSPIEPMTRTLCRSVCVKDLMDIRIGAVTGDSSYFCITEREREHWGLPVSSLLPLVCKAKHLRAPAITQEIWDSLKSSDQPVWLFRPELTSLEDPGVASYLTYGEAGGCKRGSYKISNRRVWHQTPLPVAPHAFLSGLTGKSTWLCFNKFPSLTATNTLYTCRFKESVAEHEWWGWAISIVASASLLRERHRKYADGLCKLEPGDIYTLPVTAPTSFQGGEAFYAELVLLLLRGLECEAEERAQAWLHSN